MEFQNNTIFKRVRSFQPTLFFLLHFLRLFSTFCLFACFVGWLGQGGKPLSLSPPFFWTFFKLRNADPRSLDANLGPVPRVPLPFSCTMISSAAVEDVETSVVSKKRHLGVGNLLGIFGKDFFWEDAFFLQMRGLNFCWWFIVIPTMMVSILESQINLKSLRWWMIGWSIAYMGKDLLNFQH